LFSFIFSFRILNLARISFVYSLQSIYSESDAIEVLRSIVKALANCHLHQVVHLDLKPENVLYVDKEGTENGESVKLCDFGISRTLDPDHPAGGELTSDGKCAPDGRLHGTPGYIAPEMILQEAFDTKCDVWQLGVLAYILISGIPPFEEPPHLEGTKEGMEKMFEYIKEGDFFPFDEYVPNEGEQNPWDVCSSDAKDFIKKALTPDQDKRPGMKDLLLHPWLVNDDTRNAAAKTHNISATRANLRKLAVKERFRRNVRRLVIVNSMNKAATAFAAKPTHEHI
jgi:calcium/calmodulin-dependent protein kinase I